MDVAALQQRVLEGATAGALILERVVPAADAERIVRIIRAESSADSATLGDRHDQ
jgi:hypothetical protein